VAEGEFAKRKIYHFDRGICNARDTSKTTATEGIPDINVQWIVECWRAAAEKEPASTTNPKASIAASRSTRMPPWNEYYRQNAGTAHPAA
jgi:hypothetical protein